MTPEVYLAFFLTGSFRSGAPTPQTPEVPAEPPNSADRTPPGSSFQEDLKTPAPPAGVFAFVNTSACAVTRWEED